MEKLEKVHAEWEDASGKEESPSSPENDSEPRSDDNPENDSEPRSDDNPENDTEDKEEEVDEQAEQPEEFHRRKQDQRTDEGYANDADKTFIADIEFMTRGLTGGLNNQKKTQSVGVPVTIASTPLKETTDLLADYRKLAGN